MWSKQVVEWVRHWLVMIQNDYRPQTKLRKGNVFRSVCLSRRGGVVSWRQGAVKGDAMKGVLWRGSIKGGAVKGCGCLEWGGSWGGCHGGGSMKEGVLWKGVLWRNPHFLVNKQVVRILLECFLVKYVFMATYCGLVVSLVRFYFGNSVFKWSFFRKENTILILIVMDFH